MRKSSVKKSSLPSLSLVNISCIHKFIYTITMRRTKQKAHGFGRKSKEVQLCHTDQHMAMSRANCQVIHSNKATTMRAK